MQKTPTAEILSDTFLKLTILRDQWVVGGTEIDEPIPLADPEQDGHGVEGGGQHRGSSVGDQVRLADEPDIAESREGLVLGDEVGQPGVL